MRGYLKKRGIVNVIQTCIRCVCVREKGGNSLVKHLQGDGKGVGDGTSDVLRTVELLVGSGATDDVCEEDDMVQTVA